MKRYIKSKVSLLILPLLIVSSSCTKNFEDINTDPNNLVSVTPGSLLTPLLYDIGDYNTTRSYNFTWQLMQVGFPYPSTAVGTHRYDITPTAGNGTWNKGYQWLRTIRQIHTSSDEFEQPVYHAVAATLEALTVGILTDVFGDVPYSEAIKLDEDISMPKFDSQSDIYKSLIQNLEDANEIYKNSEGIMAGNDFLYENDPDKWRKFNNSLLLRLLLRTSKKSEMDSYNRIKSILDNPEEYPIFESNEDAAILKVSGLDPYEYAWPRRQDYTLNETKAEFFVDFLNEAEDPRRPYFMSEAVTNDGDTIGYKGIPAAHPSSASYSFTPSIPNPDLMSPKVVGTIVHHILMSYAEVEFIKSEVFLHFGNNDKAEAAYKKGVIAGMTHWQWAEDEDFQTPSDSFFDNAKVKFNNSLERIIEQKYLALYMNDYQQWFEYRRTGYPVLPKTDEMLHNGVMPTRLPYHDKLSVFNPEHYKEAVSKLDEGDTPQSKVWWEK